VSQEGGVFIVPEDQREELAQALYENAIQQQKGLAA